MTVGNYYRFDNKGTAFYYCSCEPWLSLSGVRQPCPGPFQSLSLALYGFSTFSKSTFGPQGPLARISRCKVPRGLSRYSPVVGGPPAQIISLDLIGPHRDLLGWALGYGARAELGGMDCSEVSSLLVCVCQAVLLLFLSRSFYTLYSDSCSWSQVKVSFQSLRRSRRVCP